MNRRCSALWDPLVERCFPSSKLYEGSQRRLLTGREQEGSGPSQLGQELHLQLMGLDRRGLDARGQRHNNLAELLLLLTSLVRDSPSLHKRDSGLGGNQWGNSVWPLELKHDLDKEGQDHKCRLRTMLSLYIQYIRWPDDLVGTCCPSVMVNFY